MLRDYQEQTWNEPKNSKPRTSRSKIRNLNLPNLCLDFKTEPNLKRPNLEPLVFLKRRLLGPPSMQIFWLFSCNKVKKSYGTISEKRCTFSRKIKL